MPSVGLYTSATGLTAADFLLDTTGNNVANANTTGYKTAQVTFQDLFYQTLSATGPVASQVGLGTVRDSVTGLFTQGAVQPTGVPLDVAIDGAGFLTVGTADGGVAYTRRGDLSIDAANNLVTADGLLVLPPVTLPPGATGAAVGADGTVTATAADGSTVVVGRVGLTRFVNPAGLLRAGDTLFVESAGSGPPTAGLPGEDGLGVLQPGALEQSNVDLTTELVTLLVAQRTFSTNAQAFGVQSAVLQATADLIQL